MRITVKLFGAVREAAGVKELSAELAAGSDAGRLRELLASDHPIFEEFGDRLAVCVNFEIASSDTVLSDGDEVAFLPPVSGGSGLCSLSDRPLDVDEVAARVTDAGMGGIVTFVGAVRDQARGRRIQHLEYEAYPEMAEREMEKIAERAG